MRSFIERSTQVKKLLKQFPAVAIVGPRQCGKSTLAKHILKDIKNSLFLDLQRPSDRNKLLLNPELFLKENRNRLICLDEIQEIPELFPLLRSEIDDRGKAGQFLVLGSASPHLLAQSSETLAGRIAYEELGPFTLEELGKNSEIDLWLKGGYPLSYLTKKGEESNRWRQEYIKTFLERDIPQLGFNIPARQLERFWRMLAHVNGHVLNSSKLGSSMDLTNKTIRHYIDILEQTFVVRVLEPLEVNLKKRLTKAPKVYIRDTGLLHQLLDIKTKNELFSHPQFGSSWEGFVIEQVLRSAQEYRSSFVRVEKEVEIDLILESGNKRIGIECKYSSDPKVNLSTKRLAKELSLDMLYIVAPIEDSYKIEDDIKISSLFEVIKSL